MIHFDLISLSTVLENWKHLAPNEMDVNEDLAIEYLIDAVDDIGAYKQYKEKVETRKIKDYKVKLPCGFKQTIYVLIRPFQKDSDSKFELTELVRPEYGTDCTWTYKKTCKCLEKCEKDCSGNYIETTGTWYLNNLYKLESNKFATVYDFTNWHSIKQKDWKILMPKKSELAVSKHLNLDLAVETTNQYDIHNGYLITDYKDGEIILSYLSLPTGDDNLPMVPNNGNYLRALEFALEQRYAYMQYRKSRDNKDLQFFKITEQEYIKYKMKAREDINAMTFSEHWSMGEALNQFLVPNSYHNLGARKSQTINNQFTKY